MWATDADKFDVAYLIVDVVVGVFDVACSIVTVSFGCVCCSDAGRYAFNVKERFSAISHNGGAERFEFVQIGRFYACDVGDFVFRLFANRVT